MTHEEIVKNLTYVLDRQAIYDCIANYSRLVDRLDRSVLYKVYHKDAVDDHNMFVGTPEDFFDWVYELHTSEQISTQHNVGAHLCEIDGDSAHAETYFTYGAMNRERAPATLTGGRYFDRLEKRDGKWGVVARKFVLDWAVPAINTREKFQTPEGAMHLPDLKPFELAIAAGTAQSARDESDPSYERPLRVSPDRIHDYARLKQEYEQSDLATRV